MCTGRTGLVHRAGIVERMKTAPAASDEAENTPARREGRERIAEGALRLFLEQGVDKTSLRQIAQSLGLSKSGLYHHVAAKAELLDLLIGAYVHQLRAVLNEHSTAQMERRDVVRRIVQVQFAHRDVTRLISTDVAAATHASRAWQLPELLERLYHAVGGPDPSQEQLLLVRAAFSSVEEIVATGSGLGTSRTEELAVEAAVSVIDSAPGGTDSAPTSRASTTTASSASPE